MYHLEIIIGLALLSWAIFFAVRHAVRPFKENCTNHCEGCTFANQCRNKFK